MIIYGGINESGKVLDEVWLFSFEKTLWLKINDIIRGEEIPTLAMHSMCSIFPDELNNINNINIFKHPEFLCDSNNSRYLKIGLYIFGGIKGPKKIDSVSFGDISKDL